MTAINASILALLPAVACAALVVSAAAAYRTRIGAALVATRAGSLVALLCGIASVGAIAARGDATSPLLGAAGLGFAFRLDALSAIVFLLIAFVGFLVIEFSRNYLAGSGRHAEFQGHLALTVAAAILMTTAGNLGQLVVGWIATSLVLHRLLLFFGDRRRARVAARKKYLVARLGDVSLIIAAIVLWRAFGTADIATILAAARDGADGSVPMLAVNAAAALLVLSAILKSAQFPAHGWITEVMETPTPVSALLHAGIVNAGGFLIFRFADVVVLSAGSMQLLVIIGGFTALYGSLVMTAQTTVKGALAHSTIAQMGFMLMQCGFGAFSSAGLHLVAHSLYKAHSFLASGTAVDQVKTIRAVSLDGRAALPMLVASLVLSLAIFAGVGMLFAHEITGSLGVQTLGAIFIMGLFVFIAKGAGSAALLARVVPVAAIAATLYFALQVGAAAYFGAQVPVLPAPGVFDLIIAALVISSFAALTLLQLVSAPNRSRWFRMAYVHAANGFYANAVFSRLTGALRRDVAN